MASLAFAKGVLIVMYLLILVAGAGIVLAVVQRYGFPLLITLLMGLSSLSFGAWGLCDLLLPEVMRPWR